MNITYYFNNLYHLFEFINNLLYDFKLFIGLFLKKDLNSL